MSKLSPLEIWFLKEGADRFVNALLPLAAEYRQVNRDAARQPRTKREVKRDIKHVLRIGMPGHKLAHVSDFEGEGFDHVFFTFKNGLVLMVPM